MSEMATEYERRPITVDEYHWLAKQGFFDSDGRVELLDGELIRMPPRGPEHAYSSSALSRNLVLRFAGRAVIQPAGSVILDRFSEPEPDMMILKGALEAYKHRVPVPSDVALVIEISDSSLAKDRNRKSKAYARTGICEYWIVDLVHDCIEVRRDPRGDAYASVRIAHRGETVAAAAFPNDEFAVEDFLP